MQKQPSKLCIILFYIYANFTKAILYSEEYDEEKESVSPLHSPNPKSKDNKSPESVEKKKPSIKDKKLMFQGKFIIIRRS